MITARSRPRPPQIRTTAAFSMVIALVCGSTMPSATAAEKGARSHLPIQCVWSDEFNLTGFDRTVLTSVVWDDGSGPALYVGGEFEHQGKDPVPFAARWDALTWQPLVGPKGTGVDGPVRQLAVFDDGSGEALYAGGDFTTAGGEIVNGVARWDGRGWSPLLGDGGVGLDDGAFAAMTVYDFGHGSALTIGGNFETAGGEPVNNIALWDGNRWQPLIGLSGIGIGDEVTGMTVAMGRLYVTHGESQGYSFRTRLSFWDHTWVPVDGLDTYSEVAIAAFDDGSGEALYVSGGLDYGEVRRWNGAEWSPLTDSAGLSLDGFLGYPVGPLIDSLATIDLGDGPALYLGGAYCWRFDGQECIFSMLVVRWDGDWELITDETDGLVTDAIVATMTAIDDRAGRSLVVGGWDLADGSTVLGAVGRWDGAAWSAMGTGEGNGLAGGRLPGIASMAELDDGSRPTLFASGRFTIAGGTAAARIARWGDGSWTPLVDDHGNGACAVLGCETPAGLVVLDDGHGPALHAVATVRCSERYTSIGVARWDDNDWSLRGQTACFYNSVNDVTVFDDGTGPSIYGCGLFATWNETVMEFTGASWRRMPDSGGYPPGGEAKIVQGWSRGAGKGLYVAGDFSAMGGLEARGFIRWDGQHWSVPEGPPGVQLASGTTVGEMVVFDDGTGEALYVGGANLTAGATYPGVVKWNGDRWRRLDDSAGRLRGNVAALAFFDDGGGPKLFAATNEQLNPEGTFSAVSRWDGDRWTVVGSWSSPRNEGRYLVTLFTHDDGSGASLYLGGHFTEFAGVQAHGIARYSCTPPSYGPGAVRPSGRRVRP